MYGQRKRRQSNNFKAPAEMQRRTATAPLIKSLQAAFRQVCFEERGYYPYMALDNEAIWMTAADEYRRALEKHPSLTVHAFIAFVVTTAHFKYPISVQTLAQSGTGLKYEWEGEEWRKTRTVMLINQVRNIVEMASVFKPATDALTYADSHSYSEIAKYVISKLLSNKELEAQYFGSIARDAGRTYELEATVAKLVEKYKNTFLTTA